MSPGRDFGFILSLTTFSTSHRNWHLKSIWAIRTHLQTLSSPNRIFAFYLGYSILLMTLSTKKKKNWVGFIISKSTLRIISVSRVFCELLQRNHFSVRVCVSVELNNSEKMPFEMSSLAVTATVASFPASYWFFCLRGCNDYILPSFQAWEPCSRLSTSMEGYKQQNK